MARKSKFILKDWVKITLVVIVVLAAMAIAGAGDMELIKLHGVNRW